MTEHVYGNVNPIESRTEDEINELIAQDPSIEKARQRIEAIRSAIDTSRRKASRLLEKSEKLSTQVDVIHVQRDRVLEKINTLKDQLDALNRKKNDLLDEADALLEESIELEDKAQELMEADIPHENARFVKIKSIENMIEDYIQARKKILHGLNDGVLMSELVEEREVLFGFTENVNKVYYSKGTTNG